MKRKQIGFIGSCLTVGLIAALTMGMAACSSTKASNQSTTLLTTTTPKATLSSIMVAPVSPTNLKVGSTQQFSATGTYSDGSTADITSKVTWTSDTTSAATISSSGLATSVAPGDANITAAMSGITSSPTILTVVSRFQGSATGTWSGTITINDKARDVGGELTESIDANGHVTGSITGTAGSVSNATHSLQIDPSGNVTGTSSFVVGTTTYTFTFQGKVTVSGTNISFSGTWTGQYGNGVFSLTGTTSS
jgi:trimeric autotransporter adhesin